MYNEIPPLNSFLLLLFQIQSGKKVIIPWTIMSSFETSDTFATLYDKVAKKNNILKYALTTTKLGKSKAESFDNVELNVNVVDAVSTFGRFVRFYVESESDDIEHDKEPAGDNTPGSAKMNAFSVLMNASKRLTLPEKTC